MTAVSQLSREALILVPLGLPFFVPLAFSERLGIGFGFVTAMCAGLFLASLTVGAWLLFGPSTQ